MLNFVLCHNVHGSGMDHECHTVSVMSHTHSIYTNTLHLSALDHCTGE